MNSILAAVLVFVSSAAVLVLEILSLRLVAPYVGITLEVSTAVIGMALGAIALGSWAGGLAADRLNPRRLLGPLLVGGGGLILFVAPTVRAVGEAIENADDGAVFAITALAVFVPAALLSAVSPIVVKTQLGSLARTGSVVGSLSGLGTLGALFGTFLTGFLLVSAAPVSRILFVLGLGLIGLGLAMCLRSELPAAGAGGVGATVLGAATLFAPQPCDVETAYHCASVVVDPNRATGRTLQLDTLRHSYVDLADPRHLEFAYIRAFAAVVDAMRPAGAPLKALHVGGGAATLPRYLAATRPGSDNLVVEIDGGVVDLARERLGLVTGNGIEVSVRDGRLALSDQGDETRDLVVMDAFGGISVPWHLTTREVVREVRRILGPDGVYLVNVIDYTPAHFARAEVATIASVFRNVAVVASPEVLDTFGGGNILLVASDAPLPSFADAVGRDAPQYVVRTGADVATFAGGARVLRDDFAPVDQLLNPPPG
ncbi:MAG: fused MFS/spermidine synthase [Sporichthyaceae bacterium]